MADSEKTIRLKLEVQEAQANVNIKKLNQSLKRLDGRTKEYKLAVKQLAIEESKLSQVRSNMSASSDKLTTSMKSAASSTGGATAAAMELGRVVSDAPYGIRGMANNVSQLASQLFFMANQQKTATVAVKSDTVAKGVNSQATAAATATTVGFTGALKMMWSALRGPMGVLLAIQVVISALDYFAGSTKKTEDSTKSFTEELQKQVDTLKIYDTILKESNLSIEERNGALAAAAMIDKELSKILTDNVGNIEKQTEGLSEFISMKEEELELKVKINELEQVSKELEKIKGQQELQNLEDVKTKIQEVKDARTKANAEDVIFDTNKNLLYSNQIGSLTKILRLFEKQKTLLLDVNDLFKPDEDGKDSILRGTIAWYNAQIKGLKEIQNEASLTNAAYQPLQEQIEKYLNKIDEIRYPKREDVEQVDSLETGGIENVLESPGVLFETARGEAIVNAREAMANKMEKIRTTEAVAELITEEFKRKTAEATMKHAEGIFRNLQGLAGKSKALRAAFIIAEKAASIGLMYQSYNEAKMANVAHAALLGPVAGSAYLKGANALATVNLVGGIASTVAQTSKALSALNAGGSGGGGGVAVGGGGESREFDFNLVGSTGVNQLAEGIGGQFGQPIQAYVVSSQMTSQQQLDGIIQSNATIGD